MAYDSDLLERLPLNQQELLARAIGRNLKDVCRLFYSSLEEFLRYEVGSTASDYFLKGSGPTSFHFSDGVRHTFGVWGEALSLVVSPDPMPQAPDAALLCLADDRPVDPEIKTFLGRRCEDARVWLFKDDHDEREPKQAGISYCFDDGRELLYCIYIHGVGDSDSLLPSPISPELVAACFSIRERRDIVKELIESRRRGS